MVHDFSKDDGLSASDLFSLAERYHAFSGSQLQAYTLPTVGASSSDAGDVEVVQPEEASAMIAQFLGGSFGPVTTPPLDAYGNPLTLTPPTAATGTSTSGGAGTAAPAAAPAAAPTGAATPAGTVPANTIPSYDPRPC